MKNLKYRLPILAVLLCLFSATISGLVLVDLGKVNITNVENRTELGRQSGYLFTPNTMKMGDKLPAIVVSHGATSSAENVETWSIELARRGYVVYAPDLYGHGGSSMANKAYAETPQYDSNGLIDAVEYLSTLSYVDENKIGVTGHSLGGGSSIITAAYYSQLEADAIASGMDKAEAHKLNKVSSALTIGFPLEVNIVGFDSTSSFDGLDSDLGVILGQYDDFMSFLNKDILENEDGRRWLKTQTGIEVDIIEEGYFYVNAENGYRFAMWNPREIHNQNQVSFNTTGYMLDYFDETIGSPIALSSSNQTWYIKRLVSSVGIVGFFLLIISLVPVITDIGGFKRLRQRPVELEPLDAEGKKSYVKKVIFSSISSTLLMLPAILIGSFMLPTTIWPQMSTNGFVFWGLLGGIITIFTLRKGQPKDKAKRNRNLGLTTPKGVKRRTYLLIGFIIVASAYLMMFIVKWIFNVDFRVWNYAIMTFRFNRVTMWLRYLPLFAIFQMANAMVAYQTNWRGVSDRKRIMISSFITLIPVIIMLLITYTPILFIGSPMWGQDGSNIILLAAGDAAIKILSFVVSMVVVSFINIKSQKHTGNVWLGTFINMFVIAMIAVANSNFLMPF